MNRQCPECKQNRFVSTEEIHRNEIPMHIYVKVFGKNGRQVKNPRPWWFCSGCGYGPSVDAVLPNN